MAQPVAGAEVYLYDSKQVKRPADFISPKTKTDGSYKLTVPAGVYWAVAILRRTGPSFGPLQVGDKHSGEPLVLDLKNKKIEGSGLYGYGPAGCSPPFTQKKRGAF